jgi:outer membrane protein assembly factor BamB
MLNNMKDRNEEDRHDEEWPMYGHDVRRTGNGERETVPTSPIKEAWRFDTTGEINAPPVVGGEAVFFGTTAGEVYALNATTGETRWQKSLDRWIRTSPVVDSKLLFVGSGDSRVYAFDRQTGKEKWRTATKAGITTPPLRLNDLLIGANRSGQVFAIDIQSGHQQWDYETTSGISVPIAAKDGTVIAVSDNGVAYHLDAYTGTKQETQEVAAGEPVLNKLGDILFIGGKLLLGTNFCNINSDSSKTAIKGRAGFRNTGGVIGETPADKTSWSIEIGNHSTKPVVHQDTVLVGGSEALYAIDLETGRPQWEFETEEQNLTSPVVASGWIYVGSDAGVIYGLTGDTASNKKVPDTQGTVIEHCSQCEADLTGYDTMNFCPECGAEI